MNKEQMYANVKVGDRFTINVGIITEQPVEVEVTEILGFPDMKVKRVDGGLFRSDRTEKTIDTSYLWND